MREWRLRFIERRDLEAERALFGSSSKQDFEALEEPWEPVRPEEVPLPETIALVDGKERIDAGVVRGEEEEALLVTLAAGLLLREGGRMRLCPPTVERWAVGAKEEVRAGPLLYRPFPVGKGEPEALLEAVRELRVDLEARVASQVEEGLLVVDGPILFEWKRPVPVLGYVKSHWSQHLPPERQEVLRGLREGERTPAFAVERQGRRFASWYLRLPGALGGSQLAAGILRVEAPLAQGTRALADLSARLFAAWASSPMRDPRAPQNLLPTGFLERELSRWMAPEDGVRRILLQHLERAS